jgi:hypothetical protein
MEVETEAVAVEETTHWRISLPLPDPAKEEIDGGRDVVSDEMKVFVSSKILVEFVSGLIWKLSSEFQRNDQTCSAEVSSLFLD